MSPLWGRAGVTERTIRIFIGDMNTMAKVFLICGKICSGKSTYARELAKTHNAVILSADEIMLAIFGQDAGENHDLYMKKLQKHLYQKSLEIAASDINVILDFGFWTRQERKAIREFFRAENISFELHYLNITHSEWKKRLAKRNTEILQKRSNAYFVDEELEKKCEKLFEQPEREEIDVWIEAGIS